jgi:hypothetical protein
MNTDTETLLIIIGSGIAIVLVATVIYKLSIAFLKWLMKQ